MAKRADGMETRDRLLDAACEVFAEKGYHDATVAEICRRAGANQAAVNYHFGDKAALYIEAWKRAFERFVKPDPLESGHASPEERLADYIHGLMRIFTEHSVQGQFTRLYLMEFVHPTGLIRESWHELIEPRRQKVLGIIRSIMGKDATDETVLFCEMSILSQCRVLLTISPEDLEYLLERPLSKDLVERLADHIVRFSLEGIRAVGKGEGAGGGEEPGKSDDPGKERGKE